MTLILFLHGLMSEEQINMAVNLRNWDQRVPIHLKSKLYQDFLTTLRDGGHCLNPAIVREVGDVSGKSLLHLQCHIGHDTLSWSRLGARATGLDFSPAAIEAAQELAKELKLDARFVCANVYEARKAIDESFDVVFASVGVFCWVPDLSKWMRTAASMLKKKGFLYFMDSHPFVAMLEERSNAAEGVGLAAGYFERGPHHYEPGPSYASDSPEQITSETVEWTHTVGDLVTAITDARLRIEFLHEHPHDFYRRFPAMEPCGNGRWKLPGPLGDKVPMVMSLKAVAD